MSIMSFSAIVCPWLDVDLLYAHMLRGAIEGRLSHLLPRWFRTVDWVGPAREKNSLKILRHSRELNRIETTERTVSEKYSLSHWAITTDLLVYKWKSLICSPKEQWTANKNLLMHFCIELIRTSVTHSSYQPSPIEYFRKWSSCFVLSPNLWLWMLCCFRAGRRNKYIINI